MNCKTKVNKCLFSSFFMVSILVFGDSITYGMWDERGGWVQRLRMYFDKIFPQGLLIYNLGIPGDNTEGLLERFEFEVSRRIDADNDIIIFAIGINDSMRVFEWNRVSIDRFESNLRKLVSLARKFVGNIIFLGLTPVNEKLTFSFVNNQGYVNHFIREYDLVIKEVCSDEDVNFIDIWDVFNNLDYIKLLSDGLHPNSQGHLVIYEEVKKALREIFTRKG